MEEKPSQATKTIRITRTEAYAMRLAKPRKKPMTFLLWSLAILAVLAGALWVFQDIWLPYWLPEDEPAPPAPATTAEVEPVVAEPVSPAPVFERTAAVFTLDYLSAATWDHPDFIRGVRLYNRAIDQLRLARQSSSTPSLLESVRSDALQAAVLFDSVQPLAPAGVSIAGYADRARRLAAEAVPADRASAKPQAAETMTLKQLKAHPEFQRGAQLFNQALEQFNRYKKSPARKDLLGPTEDLARQAGETFEGLKRQVPAGLHDDLDRIIHQCYGMVSACRGARLSDGSAGKENTRPDFNRGTAGPSRRPALPAYQPVQ